MKIIEKSRNLSKIELFSNIFTQIQLLSLKLNYYIHLWFFPFLLFHYKIQYNSIQKFRTNLSFLFPFENKTNLKGLLMSRFRKWNRCSRVQDPDLILLATPVAEWRDGLYIHALKHLHGNHERKHMHDLIESTHASMPLHVWHSTITCLFSFNKLRNK